MVKKEERIIRIITLGPSGVGKTSIIERIINKRFEESYFTTISIDFYHKIIDYKNLKLKLHYVDTAGQERYNKLPLNYIRNASIILFIFDDLDSLIELEKRWYKFYEENEDIKKSISIVIGNKSDAYGDKRQEIIELGKKFSDKIDAFFISCSAKSADNIDNLENIIEKEAKRLMDQKINQENYLKLLKQKEDEKRKCPC